MSFSEQVKEELQALAIKSMCCRKAFLFGLMLGARLENDTVVFRLPTAFAEHAASEIKRHFGRESCAVPFVQGRASGMQLRFAASKSALQIEAWDAGECADFSAICKCPQCASAFLRGAFCACGTVSDPATGSHLEIKAPTRARAMGLCRMLAGEGVSMGLVQRGSSIGVYVKNSQGVEDVLSVLGSSTMVFELLNKKIEREIRGNENRVTNCDTGNIGKYVAAAIKQNAAIEKLERYGELDKLPDPLRETALLRRKHANASLGELAEAHVPPISKSGLNHRLQKLIDLANELPD